MAKTGTVTITVTPNPAGGGGERTPERLAAGLPWPDQEVLDLYAEVVHYLEGRGVAGAADKAYRGVMAAGSVFAAGRLPCPALQHVLAVIQHGEQLADQVERQLKGADPCSR